ncbi:putative DNA binding domain-containing protein [Frankia sp. AgB1.9]|uniref:ATP-binding protein n=1 Tax=unclassified Frankia TaxID=2632575 RepID=UPI00193169AA|nr:MULTISPECIES: ATP-binding protein [unclassified Frankia]MBL7491565.1 putative DNA binding domain-containing protein [Frankia sp. AgW1.1]MBL7547025.1 putative DNA binding domain-containing protein [Frankia sp. AgB1.9]MBL7617646.1 putative DNA binding domain-containing protein [Frankia sp. AgB1.8]
MDRETVSRILADLARLGRDNYRVEVKKARGGMPTTLHETISAFANADGGTIILGVDEKASFEVTGLLDPDGIRDRFVGLCRSMEPAIAAPVDIVDMSGSKVLVAEIPGVPREHRPCHLASMAPWDSSFVRMSDGDRKLSAYEVQILLENRKPVRHDASVVTEASEADLDRPRVDAYLARVREQRGVFTGRTDDEILRLLNVLRDTPDGPRPTLAGLLAFGRYPQQHLPQLNVTVTVFPTPDPTKPGPRGERFLDSRSIDGSIPLIVQDAIALLKRHMKQRSIIAGIFRIEEWEYPEEVLREVLVNAIAHRDYSSSAQGAQVQVELYPDRLLVRNPGGLFGPLNIAELGLGTIPASSRNLVLLKILEDTPLEPGHTVCENRGTGIAQVRATLSNAGMEPARFEDNIATFAVTIPNHALLDEPTISWLSTMNVEALSRGQLTAMALARRGEILTNVSYRQATGVADSRTATAHLRELCERGLLVRRGERGQSTYRLASGEGRNKPRQEIIPAVAHERTPRTHRDVVLASLSNEPTSRRVIVDQTGLTDVQVRNALGSLRRARLAEIVGPVTSKNALWRLADDQPAS